MKKIKLMIIVAIILFPVLSSAKIEVDTDKDGLSDYEETIVYKSDINKKDTDGDGYNDGEEVDNGYSPTAGKNIKLKSVKLAVPYISEAPDGNWSGPWKNACEEASIAMVEYYYRGVQNVAKETSKNFMWSLFDLQDKKYGSNADANSVRTKYMIDQTSVFSGKIVKNPTIEQIKIELQQRRPVISLHYGFDLKNKNIPFLANGSSYHMMPIIGYDDDKKLFYTNDPGDTIAGNYHEYSYDLFMKTLHDFNHVTGKANDTPVVIFSVPKIVRLVDGKLFYIDLEFNTYHKIVSPEVFKDKKWHWEGVFAVEASFLDQYKAGDDFVPEKQTTPMPIPTTEDKSKKYNFTSYLTIGSRGEEVKQLQLKLKELGHFTYPQATGYYGPVTKSAVIKFQQAKKLYPYPGWVGPATRSALNK